MADFGIPVLALLLGLLAGGLIARLTARRPPGPTAAAFGRLTHDLRGSLSPAMLMAERLERHADENVRQAADIITRALERAAGLCRDASAAAKQARS